MCQEKYTHKGFPPPQPTLCWGRPQRGRGGAWGGAGGIPYGYFSILDIGYWISICTHVYMYVHLTVTYEYIYVYIQNFVYIYTYVCIFPTGYSHYLDWP